MRVLARLFKRLPDLCRATQAVGRPFKKPSSLQISSFDMDQTYLVKEKKEMDNRSTCTEPEGRGKLFEKFVAGELGEWGRSQFMGHVGSCEFCQKEVMIHFLEPVIPTLPPADQTVLQTAIQQWRHPD